MRKLAPLVTSLAFTDGTTESFSASMIGRNHTFALIQGLLGSVDTCVSHLSDAMAYIPHHYSHSAMHSPVVVMTRAEMAATTTATGKRCIVRLVLCPPRCTLDKDTKQAMLIASGKVQTTSIEYWLPSALMRTIRREGRATCHYNLNIMITISDQSSRQTYWEK
jgi:hypothetical protein